MISWGNNYQLYLSDCYQANQNGKKKLVFCKNEYKTAPSCNVMSKGDSLVYGNKHNNLIAFH